MDFITAPLVVGMCVFGIYKLFELYARRRERMMLIEKLDSNISLEEGKIRLPDYSFPRLSFSALKIGSLLVGVGLGLLTGFIICILLIPNYISSIGDWETRQIGGLIYGSSVLLFGGIALIIAFTIEVRMNKKNKTEV